MEMQWYLIQMRWYGNRMHKRSGCRLRKGNDDTFSDLSGGFQSDLPVEAVTEKHKTK